VSDDDRGLGMSRPITRRDFLDGMAAGAAGLTRAARLTGPARIWGQPAPPYPPALTGLRGSHVGAFEAFHALRDGRFWDSAPTPRPTGERYDLVVVGAGISGLAAAHYSRKRNPRASVLILDNHDDFGGHAKRNEFSTAGRTYLGYGGTQSIDSPAPYSKVAKELIAELGIDVARYRQVYDHQLYRSLDLRSAFFFDRETFGVDKLVRASERGLEETLAEEAPIPAAAKRDLRRLLTERFDPYPGETSAAKRATLARISYADFLTTVWRLDRGVLAIFQTAPHGLFGAGIDAVPAQDAFGLGLPGFQGMALDPAPGPGQNYDAIRSPEAEDYYFHFPDGNASIARLLVRRLLPGAVPGRTMTDVVTARVDYGRLDRAGSPVRIRLASPVMRVRHLDAPGKGEVEVTYLAGKELLTVRGGAVVLACWHAPIPYFCPELPVEQKKALAFAIKVPLVYTNVLIRNWTAFQRLGVSAIESPGFWHTSVALDQPVSIGGYRHPRTPAEPIVLHLSKAACKPGLPIREQHRVGRNQLYATSFETIERSIRTQLGRILGPGGFDPASDILGITVNRWPHGYAYQYNSLWDDFWFRGGVTPCEIARRRFGRIAIANADAGAYSYTDAAIDHAHRAIQDLAAAE
jgi:spermidine dehydrogenase